MTALDRQTRMPRQPDSQHPHAMAMADVYPRLLPGNAEAATEQTAKSHPGDPLAERLAYSVAEAALLTGLSRDLLYHQMRLGKLAYLKVGRRRIITRDSLEAFLSREAS